MKKSFTKSAMRQIFSNKSRFIAIFAIVLIGVGFFAGILATGDDMRLGADRYYDEYGLMDFRLISTYGFSDRDVAALKDMGGIEVYPSYYHDFVVDIDGSETVCRAFSYNAENAVNIPYLVEGRLPENDGECLLNASVYSNDLIGTKITLSLDDGSDMNDVLSQSEYTVVGIFLSPMYVSATQYGSTNIASGKISKIALIPESCFQSKYYTEIYLKYDELKALSSYSSAYETLADTLSEEVEKRLGGRAFIRLQEIKADAEEELERAKAELADAQTRYDTEVSDAKLRLYDAKIKLDEAEEKLKDAEQKITDGKTELSEKRAEYEKEIADAEAQIKEAQNTIADYEYSYRKGMEKYEAGAAEYEAGVAAADQLKEAITAMTGIYGEDDPRVVAAKAQYETLSAQLAAAKVTLDKSYRQLAAARKELDDAIMEFNRARHELPIKKAEAEEQFAEAEREIAEAEVSYSEGLAEYEENLAKYNEENEKFLAEVEKADAEIADAEEQIAEAEDVIADLKEPEYYVFGRDANPAYTEYGQNAERMDNIAKIFPVFFLLVAMLVSLTTMARMVEDDRTQIGTIKALGYRNAAVIKKYMLYALTATVGGAVIGVIIGFVLLPKVIMNAYSILYQIPYSPTPFVWSIAIPSILAAVICITVTVWFTVKAYARELPSRLMRPGTPPKGKKIWIERIPALWNMLNFTAKVSARNIFRYKKRMLMTSIGIAGCTALILTGFGLKDSISDIVGLQYNDLWHYDALVVLDDANDSESISRINSTVASFDKEYGSTMVMQKTYSAVNGDSEVEINLLTAADADVLSEMITFRTRRGHESLSLDDSGAIITEKLASLLGISQGDTITVKISDEKTVRVPVTAITENYVYHYVYMSENAYRTYIGEELSPNCMMLRYDVSDEDALVSAVLENDNILSLTRSSTIMETFSGIMGILNSVVLVLIISAGALAFVVLYNLTNINISERIREIATLKVLGFRDGEVSMYIFRENIVLTLIGSVFGLLGGRLLTAFVITTAEIDIVMFGRSVSVWSYLFAFLLTFAFSIIASFAMKPKLDKISMTESLKSVE